MGAQNNKKRNTIHAHGLQSERYVYDNNGQLIPDSSVNGRNGYKVTGDTGFYVDNDKISGVTLKVVKTGLLKLVGLQDIMTFLGPGFLLSCNLDIFL